MKTLRQIYLKIPEIALLLILMILPFSYKTINVQSVMFLSISVVACIFLLLSKMIRQTNYSAWVMIFALLFMFIFDITEKVNIIKHIPLSTVLISITMFALMIKMLVEGKLEITNHPFAKYFFYACAFLFISMVLFYPFFFYHYQMQANSNIQLLSRILKYIIIFIVVANYLSDEKKFKRMNFSFIFSLCVTITLSIIL